MKPWDKVRTELNSLPIIEGVIDAGAPLYVERYLFRDVERQVTAVDTAILLVQLGGARVHEGEHGHWRATSLPSQAVLLPAGCPTHWHYAGTIDFVAFYFPANLSPEMARLHALAENRNAPVLFSDQLVGAAAMQLVNELQKQQQDNQAFVKRLAIVMLEQSWRVMTEVAIGGCDPRHIHYPRLQTVLGYIHENLAAELSAAALAQQAGVSLAHLRRFFFEAMGLPVHRYVMRKRLDEARKLLAMTTLPISRVAQDCGFSSQSHLTACFRKEFSAPPAQFRKHVSNT